SEKEKTHENVVQVDAYETNTAVNSPSESVNTAPEVVKVIYFVWALMNVSLDLCAWFMHNLCSDL
ncbi:hypothetical protein A2U01_0088537, partial [Trifolium medium]|nr:hypothetical protein [Trifolium medium]